MKKELKVKIHDYKSVEDRLKRLGGQFKGEIRVKDTYFNQLDGKVLKITEDDKGDFLVELHGKDGGFIIKKYEKINNSEELKEQLGKRYGVDSVLKKRRRFWKVHSLDFNINIIEGLGDFLILEDENPKKEIITDLIRLKDPEYVEVPFNNLKS